MGEKRMDLAEEMLHIEDVEKIASCSRRHIMDEIKKKKLRAYKPGKRLLFRVDEVRNWITKKVVV